MKCPGCGRDIGEESSFCQHCGYQIPGGTQSMQTWGPPIAQRPHEESHVATIVIVLIVVVIAVLAVALLAFVGTRLSATVVVNVYSEHILFSVEYTLSVDYGQVDSGTISPGYYVSYTHTFHWQSGEAKTVHISATSTGGGFGSQSDYEDVTMSDGGQYTVDLYI